MKLWLGLEVGLKFMVSLALELVSQLHFHGSDVEGYELSVSVLLWLKFSFGVE